MISNNSPSQNKVPSKEEISYPNEATFNYIQRQSKLYEQHKPQLLEKYQGQYILFEDGEVLDSDLEEAALVMRAYESMGIRDLFVKHVILAEPNLVARIPFT